MENFEKYARQIALDDFGEVGQKKLASAHIVIAGVGGVGSAVLPLLTGAGVGRISIFDCDNVSKSNLHRQTLYTFEDIGKPKAELAGQFVRLRNPDCNVDCFCERLSELIADDIFSDQTICIDATDSFASRMEIAKVCRKHKVRMISASAEGFIAQNFLFGDGFYFDDIMEKSAEQEMSQGVAILPPVAHISGVLSANATIKSIVWDDFKVGQFLSFNLKTMKFLSGNLR